MHSEEIKLKNAVLCCCSVCTNVVCTCVVFIELKTGNSLVLRFINSLLLVIDSDIKSEYMPRDNIDFLNR